MRNLKKVLSLVLCVAVMLSVMVLGAGAAFSDQDKIENTEAVDATTALNIISGYEDGSFHPERNIKRSEMCKMICIALNGGKEPATSTKDDPTFTDIDGHWAEGYIEYCYAKGVVSGVGGGRFNPDGNVTVTQAAKMLLVALGYNADVEQFNGTNWSLYVNVKANQDGIYEDLEAIDTAAALTRDQAAQMIWNTLQAVITVKTSSIDVTTGEVTESYSKDDKGTTMLQNFYNGAGVYEGVLTASGEYGINDDAGKDKIAMADVKKVNGATVTDNKYDDQVWNYSTDVTDLVGQYVKVLVNNKGDVYGVFPVADKNTVVTATFPNVEQDGNKIKVDGTSYTYETAAVVNGIKDSSVAVNISALGDNIASGDQITFISNNGDSKFDLAIVNPMTNFGEVLYVGADSITVAGEASSLDKADISYPEDLAEGDYVAVYTDLYTGDTMLVKAEKVTGEIEMTKDNDVRIDGTWYTLGEKATPAWDDMVLATIEGTPAAGDEYTLYVINGVVYNAELETAGSTDTAMVITAPGTLTVNGNYQVKLLLADNSQIVVEADKTYAGLNGKLVTYETDADGVYELKAVDADNKAGGDSVVTSSTGASFDESTTRVKIDGTSYRVSSTAVVYIQYEDDGDILYRAMTGSELNNLGDTFTADNNGGVVVVKDGLASIVMLKSRTNYLPGAGSDTLYGYVTDIIGKTKDYTELNVWTSNNEQLENVRVRGTAPAEGDLISFNLSADNYLEGLKIGNAMASGYTTSTVQSGAIKAFSMGEYVTFYKTNSGTIDDYNLTEDTEFIYLDTNNTAGVAGSKLAVAQKDTAGNYYINAKYIVNNDGDIVMIACDVTSRCWYEANGTVSGTVTTQLSSPSISDVTDRLNAGEPVGITGTVPAGNLVSDSGTVETILTNATIGGSTLVGGISTFEGSVSISASGKFEALEVTLSAGSTMTLDDGAGFVTRIMHIKAGSTIAFPENISFVASRDFSIDFNAGTVGDYTFTASGGLAGALTAVQGYTGTPNYGYGSWSF